MIALVESPYNHKFALLYEGQRFEFPREMGPLLADMLAEEWPPCPACEDRACVHCRWCYQLGCECRCAEEDEEDTGDGEEDAPHANDA